MAGAPLRPHACRASSKAARAAPAPSSRASRPGQSQHSGAKGEGAPRTGGRRKTASSRVSGLLRTQRRCRRAFSLPPVRIWARRTAQTRSSGIFLENPAVFFYFWNETAGAETAGLSPAAAPGAVAHRSEHAFTSWVCAQAVKNAQTAAFCMPNSVFWRHISGLFGELEPVPPAPAPRCNGRVTHGAGVTHVTHVTPGLF